MDLAEEQRIAKAEEATKGFENTKTGQAIKSVGESIEAGQKIQKGEKYTIGDVWEDVKGIFGVPGYAEGTDFHPGGWAIVGEEGPELARFPRGTEIKPADMIGGTTVNIPKLADQIVIREDADIDRIGRMLVSTLQGAGVRL
jgi:hypothetical protein